MSDVPDDLSMIATHLSHSDLLKGVLQRVSVMRRKGA
jgi:hypothetical protein